MAFPGRGPGARYMGSPDAAPVPKARRGRTIRRIVAFFRPYKGQVAVVLVAILFTSLIGLVNPILLKPESDHRSQLVVRGRARASVLARIAALIGVAVR